MDEARNATGDRRPSEAPCATVMRLLKDVAPDVDVDVIDSAASLTDEAGLDSLDFVRLMELLAVEFGVEIPVLDYPTLSSIDGLVAYLEHPRGPDAAPDRPLR